MEGTQRTTAGLLGEFFPLSSDSSPLDQSTTQFTTTTQTPTKWRQETLLLERRKPIQSPQNPTSLRKDREPKFRSQDLMILVVRSWMSWDSNQLRNKSIQSLTALE